ncbi:MAG: hypothetical protein IPM45_16665 [Acidimicrobiales bacterium]|nr:hypothetical protein [Acidimicrobiales bacterium]
MSRAVDVRAVASGAALAAVIAVPAALIGQAVDDSGERGSFVAPLVILLGLAAGAAVAAGLQHRGTPLTHGILAAATVFVVVQGIGVIRRLVAGDEISWARVFSSAVLSVVAGTVGGLIGGRVGPRDREVRP